MKKMKKFDNMLVMDKDGTLEIDNSLMNALLFSAANNCLNVLNTGRTVSEILSLLNPKSIHLFDYIAGDNGATLYSTKTEELTKLNLPPTLINNILEVIDIANKHNKKFTNNEDVMKIDNIRFTNGENIFVFDNLANRKYYEGKTVTFFNSIEDLKAIPDITKITLAGPKSLMEILQSEMSDCTMHLVKSKFPVESPDNCILDITHPEATKGNIVKNLAARHGVYNYYCFGNDWNDLSMFEEALKTGNKAFVVKKNAPPDLIDTLKEFIEEQKASGNKNVGHLKSINDSHSLSTILQVISIYMASGSCTHFFNPKDFDNYDPKNVNSMKNFPCIPKIFKPKNLSKGFNGTRHTGER